MTLVSLEPLPLGPAPSTAPVRVAFRAVGSQWPLGTVLAPAAVAPSAGSSSLLRSSSLFALQLTLSVVACASSMLTPAPRLRRSFVMLPLLARLLPRAPLTLSGVSGLALTMAPSPTSSSSPYWLMLRLPFVPWLCLGRASPWLQRALPPHSTRCPVTQPPAASGCHSGSALTARRVTPSQFTVIA